MARILIIGKYYYPFCGGIEENTRQIAEYVARFHDVTVLAFNHEQGHSERKIGGVTVRRRHAHFHYKGQPISMNLFSGIDLNAYDLIQVHSPNPFATTLLLFLRLFARKAPIIVTHHMDIIGRRLARAVSLPFIRHLIRAARVTIVSSQKNLHSSNDLPADAAYEIVPLAVAEENYEVSPALREEVLVWRQSLCGDAPLVGFVGRHVRYKGLTVLMKALAELPGVHALIGGDGPCRQSTESLARQLGISDRVHFLGHVDHREKIRLLAALDVFVFPSTEITEAFGISQMEAMLCGAPVVASNLPTGVTDVAIDGHTALLAPPNDSISLAEKIRKLIEDRSLAARLAEAGRMHVLSNMGYVATSGKALAIFEAAMQSATARPDATQS
ncbi:glycosyltransferase [Devosia sp. XJ19-1]|uniref:Glycosyltransferase n=1 Tax=Devosia ureilytica TaxID=2952754 RepID=A0A9Q4ALT9_9HYPH|nr:glycosyltransferase [Devosia ureilytica]MCP8881915.1 glycosyltransferase [Devosia ureilytica]MCP8886199.1 glycosyltransferase [Devosia ureilytica]